MSIYRESFLTENVITKEEFKDLIESSFVFLNEDASTDALKKALDELKEKDIDKITKDDLEDIVKLLKQTDASKLSVNFGLRMVGFVISFIMAVAGRILVDDNDKLKEAGLLIGGALLLSSIASCAPFTVYKSYDRIIKLEAKLNNELKKLKALGTEADKQTVKELEKTIDIIKKIKVEYKNSYKGYKEDTNLVLEFKGNEDKTEAFKIILDEMGDICEYNLEKIRLIDKTIKEIEQIMMTKASYKDLGVTLAKMTEIDKELDKKVSNLSNEMGINFSISGEVFAKNVKKFTVKYSEVSMRDKENMAKKLTGVVDKINDIMKYYNSKEFAKRADEIVEFATVNDKSGGRFEKGGAIYVGLLKYLNQEATLTKNDINSIIASLNIPKLRNSIIFKVLNPKF